MNYSLEISAPSFRRQFSYILDWLWSATQEVTISFLTVKCKFEVTFSIKKLLFEAWKVDRVQLGLPIGNKSCLSMLASELTKGPGANLKLK